MGSIFCLTISSLILKIIIDSNVLALSDSKRNIPMGNSSGCDDGKTDLDVDWDGSMVNYTCMQKTWKRHHLIHTLKECEYIPHDYSPTHYCMNSTISYDHIMPTHGDHRPVWPMFGEYVFVPVQRWSHNIEHGAIVMLYHPCADPKQVQILRELVVNCLRKHVISAYNLLPSDRPLALVSWGCRLLMNRVNKRKVISFIKETALRGPEGHYPKEGKYSELLIRLAQPPPNSDINDTNICPDM